MMTLLIVVHVLACILLITLVLIQRGRGSGLVESFAGVESMFGTKTNAFLTRSTTVLSVIFFFTCLSLAVLSVRQSRSLLANVKPLPVATQPVKQAANPPVATTASVPTQVNQNTLDTAKTNQK
jgi:preprotein translocase subunit SecG